MLAIRLCKVAIVSAIALFFTVVAYGNITDYESNWQAVQHVLSMDTTFPDSNLHWRAITDPSLQTFAYYLIIATQVVTALTLWIGVFRLLANSREPKKFAAARSTAVVGLTLGFLLYLVGFVVVGSEWFAMWQSDTMSGNARAALAFSSTIALVLIVLLMPESESNGGDVR